jgi:hypothetical protein
LVDAELADIGLKEKNIRALHNRVQNLGGSQIVLKED